MNRRRAGIGWAAAIVLVLTAMVGTAGTTAAMGADDPATPGSSAAPQPVATSTGSTSPQPAVTDSGSPSDSTSPSLSPSTDPSTSPTPTACPLCPPDSYSPPDGTLFNHPFSKASYRTIRNHVLRTINSVPSGGRIRLAIFSLNDQITTDALLAAVARGVSVQIVVDNHNLYNTIPDLPPSPSFIQLRNTLGNRTTRPGIDPERLSFAKICHSSCRGTGGNVHYKLFLFDMAGPGTYDPATGTPTTTGGTRWITMMGSPNLTLRASHGQWNHLDTYSNSKATYDYYDSWFQQMKADTPVAHPYLYRKTGAVMSWTFPKPGTTATTDPLMGRLNKIRCTGATGGTGINGRTKIRIGAYTFFDNRGRWMAKKVRSLWNAGCNISIEYSIMGDTVKRILYSPAGRGRIPMRQVVTFTKQGVIDVYDHAKYIAVSGNYAGHPATRVVWTGTTNISDLGFRSDDTQQEWFSTSRVNAYFRDFSALWTDRNAHVPSPTSRLGVRIGSPQLRLGQGAYKNLEPN